MKTLSKTLFVLYILTLLWLILFKFSFDVSSVLFDHQARSIEWIPFAGSSRAEMISNFIVFVPFGLLLSANFKQINIWRKLACVFIFSATVEIIQFILAIGVTDITDLITNTLGGLVGLMLYDLGNKYVDTKKQDLLLTVVGLILLTVFALLRIFVFKVRY
jgi:glycopeptide antibiotics resistance protein